MACTADRLDQFREVENEPLAVEITTHEIHSHAGLRPSKLVVLVQRGFLVRAVVFVVCGLDLGQ